LKNPAYANAFIDADIYIPMLDPGSKDKTMGEKASVGLSILSER
jgi:hypothetical protein